MGGPLKKNLPRRVLKPGKQHHSGANGKGGLWERSFRSFTKTSRERGFTQLTHAQCHDQLRQGVLSKHCFVATGPIALRRCFAAALQSTLNITQQELEHQMAATNQIDGALERHRLGIRDMHAVVNAVQGNGGAAFAFLGGEMQTMER